MKMKLKGLHFADVAEIQGDITDELNTAQKEEFSGAFQKLYDRAIACICTNEVYLKKKFSNFKTINHETFGPQCARNLRDSTDEVLTWGFLIL
jgi:hypothetical protein